MQQAFIEQLQADPHGFVSRYRTEFDDHYNPDNAAELFSGYSSSPEARAGYRIAVAGAAGWVADQAFQQRLAERDALPVIFMAGGTASGKSTIAGPAAAAGLIIFDSTFSNTELSRRRLQEALDAGRTALVCYIFRDPAEAWIAAERRTREEAAGRVVTAYAHASTHEGAAKTFDRLSAEFSGNPCAGFRYYTNSEAAGLQPRATAINCETQPPAIAPSRLAKLTTSELIDWVDRIAVAAVHQCRADRSLFLKRYPRLDFRNRTAPSH